MNPNPHCLLLSLLLLPAVSATQIDLTSWDFNSVPAAPEATNSPPPTLGNGVATLTGGVTATLAAGVPSGSAGRAWNITHYPLQSRDSGAGGVRFASSSVGWDQIQLRFQHRFSARSSGRASVRVSVNGADFTEVLAYEAPGADLWTNLVVDLSAIPGTADNASLAWEIVSVFAAGTNRYVAAGPGSTYSSSGTWRLDDVSIAGEPLAEVSAEPRIRVEPADRTLIAGESARLGVGAAGEEPLTYQWQLDGEDLPGETGPVLTLESVTAESAGRYRVLVGNWVGNVTSREAIVTVTPPPPPYVAMTCAALHAQVKEPDFAWIGGNLLVAVEGIVISHANLSAPGNVQFHLQDASGGIAVVWHDQTDDALPAAGSRVRVIGPVLQSGGLLQLAPDTADPLHSVTVLEEGLPPPEPVELDPAWLPDPGRMESLESRRVRISGVTLDTRSPLFPVKGANLTLTSVETGTTLTLRLAGDSKGARVDLAGQAKPTGPFTVTGIWSQNDASRPYTGSYHIVPTRYADLVPDGHPPEVHWTVTLENQIRQGDASTNQLTEQVLRPGETLRLNAEFSDAAGAMVPAAGVILPAAAQLEWLTASDTADGLYHLSARVTFTATSAHAGQLHPILLPVAGTEATQRARWTVYVPSSSEQQVVLSEFLANPAVRPDAPGFNPLHRSEWPPEDPALAGKVGAWDEFVELVNLGADPVNLGDWTISDATRIQAWISPEDAASTLAPGRALVVYGGPAGSHPPQLDVPAIPAALPGGASPGTDGLGLNNTGDSILIRNAAGHLVERIVYGTRQLSADSSLTRWPVPEGPWVPHSTLNSERPSSPGLPPLGSDWPSASPPDPLSLQIRIADDQIHLRWVARPGATYSVRETTVGRSDWTIVTNSLSAPEFTTPLNTQPGRLFQVTSP